MFAEHFGVRENPFYSLSDPDAIFPSSELREAVQHFLFARENRDAIFLLTGEVGTGKTTAIRAVCRELPRDTPIATLCYSTLGRDELIKELFLAFGLEKRARESRTNRVRRLETTLRDFVRAGHLPMLIFDEAHLLGNAVLEEVRLLTNLRHEGHPLLQVCLVGQPELAERLRKPKLRPLRQRISARYVMRPLGPEETRAYLTERARAAGSDSPNLLFDEAASRAVHELSGGIPREINVVAGQAMLNAYIDSVRVVHEEHVRSVHEDYGFEGVLSPRVERNDVAEEVDGSHRPTSTVSSVDRTSSEEPGPLELEALATTASLDTAEAAKPISQSRLIRAAASLALVSLFALTLRLFTYPSGEQVSVTEPEPNMTATLRSPADEAVSAKPEPEPHPRTEEDEPTPTAPPVSDEPEENPVPVAADLRAAETLAPDMSPGTLAQRFPSTLEVNSDFPAVVWLGNERLGMAPGRFSPVAPGLYQLKLQAGDGRVFEQDVVVTPGSTTFVRAHSSSPQEPIRRP